ncbi:ferritin-like domain-containing protein [Polyangium jinanense]|uniref:Ferritin-like domain-containing protein n=2 Tax=Polyangium jinanense TaxID=2829994 RepID=A0A9X3XHR5_9BACT|nr:ferritin-like domain-containing protein [Polyangium jinanense]MDC3988908.1 ferritin-like domain-containing protein [Polyangium jinanense]
MTWHGRPSRGPSASVRLDLREPARRARPAVPHLPHLTASAIATWRARMLNEHGSARVFEGLARQFEGAGFEAHLVEEVRGFADEERRHGVLCGAVVEALGGEALTEAPVGEAYPEHADDATPLESALRNMLSICCLSETVAVALIGAERIEMPAGELRDLLTQIYADEVGHSRFGWRMLDALSQRLDDEIKERLGDYLEVAFAHLEEHELAHLPEGSLPPPEGVVYGLCSGPDARGLFFDTVEQVIVPGLERHGIPARRAWMRRHGGAGLS